MDCFDRWAWGLISSGQVVGSNGSDWTLAGYILQSNVAGRVSKMFQDHSREQKLSHAKRLIEAEQLEAAAIIYQDLGMWKEAGDLRRQYRRQVVTQVHVNVNDLVDQLKKAGISTDYACPVCGGHIRISGATPLAKLSSCEYCGSAIQTTDLVEFLTKVVGYK